MSDLTSAPSRRRIATASFIGTTIEYYDFYIYATAAALVFGKVFFPEFSSTAGTLAAFGTFAVGFAARPIGAVVFGHYGDRLGRRTTLIVSLLVMGVATVAVGLIPSYDSIGVAAPLLLVIFRFLQGLALGGEWAGAVLLATEYAPKGKRGLYSAFPQIGPAVAFIMANGLFLVLNATMSAADFEAYGWRIPFLLSVVLLVVGYYIRTRIAETPVFQAALNTQDQSRVPFVELVRKQPRELILGTLSFILAYTLYYTIMTFSLSYGTETVGVSRTTMLVATMVAAVVMLVATLYFATLSDRWGRRRMAMIAAVLAIMWAFPLFALLETGQPVLITLALVVGVLCFAVLYGPMGAFLPELFRVRYRYSGAAFAQSFSGVLGGGISPLIATALLAQTGSSWSISVYVIVIALVCLGATALLKDTKDDDFTDGMSGEVERVAATSGSRTGT